ncbi:MAG: O-antigen ligase family protein [Verrucomicrobia bacterium]|nr:O-antigen ligase family protein [Verrucomicrobiota bacterium]
MPLMDPFDRNRPDRKRFRPSRIKTGNGHLLEKSESSGSRTPYTYQLCDGLTEGLLYFVIVFTPWAFATTQSWSIWTLNLASYVLGGLLLLKWLIRWRAKYRPPRWGDDAHVQNILTVSRAPQVATVFLALLTVLVLIYCLVSALNARAVFLPEQQRFDYRDYVRWLPHSYDQASTWNALWNYLAMAFVFWAARDWLLGKTARDVRELNLEHPAPASEPPDEAETFAVVPSGPLRRLPSRLRCLLWVLCVNGALVALEGILQRLDGTNRLLWLVEPRFNKVPATQFGPFAYHANAASFFNLLWPVCVGFWLVSSKADGRNRYSGDRMGGRSHIVLLPCAILMAASPILSSSGGTALVTIIIILAAAAIWLIALYREDPGKRIKLFVLHVVVLVWAAYFGWQHFREKLQSDKMNVLVERTEVYTNAATIARDFPVFGTGPGTFGSIYQLYKEPPQKWAAYAHDDWLETRITLGWAGLGLLISMLGIVFFHSFFRGGIPTAPEFVAMVWLSLFGCLLHAKFDFPFQINSILFVFILLSSILFCSSQAKEKRS